MRSRCGTNGNTAASTKVVRSRLSGEPLRPSRSPGPGKTPGKHQVELIDGPRTPPTPPEQEPERPPPEWQDARGPGSGEQPADAPVITATPRCRAESPHRHHAQPIRADPHGVTAAGVSREPTCSAGSSAPRSFCGMASAVEGEGWQARSGSSSRPARSPRVALVVSLVSVAGPNVTRLEVVEHATTDHGDRSHDQRRLVRRPAHVPRRAVRRDEHQSGRFRPGRVRQDRGRRELRMSVGELTGRRLDDGRGPLLGRRNVRGSDHWRDGCVARRSWERAAGGCERRWNRVRLHLRGPGRVVTRGESPGLRPVCVGDRKGTRSF